MKEQPRNTQVQINEKEIGKLPEKEFRIMIVMMIQNLKNRMEKMQESINKNLEEIKYKHRQTQLQTNNTVTEIKNTLGGINSRLSEAEERISEPEDRMVEMTAKQQNKLKRMKRAEDNLRDLWGNVKCTNIRITGIPEKKRERKGMRKSLRKLQLKISPAWERK